MDLTICIATIQAYIFHRTGKEVPASGYNVNEVDKIIKAYNIAANFFANDPNGSITLIQ